MNKDCKIINCTNCDYKTLKKYNLIRHMVRSHPTTKAMNLTAKAMEPTAKAMNLTAKAMNVTEKAMNENEDINCIVISDKQCEKCNKCFARKYNMNKHFEKCKGPINLLQCEYCKEIFTHRNNKYVHRKKCKLIQLAKQEEMQKVAIQNITNNNITNNNITNNTINDNSNNVTVNNIIVFDPKNMELLNDHITKKQLQKMVADTDFTKILTDYSTALLSRKENQCVRKTNLNSTSSSVHVGDNKWEFHTDKYIYPKLLTNIAYNLGDVKENFKVRVYEQLDNFIDDVASEATDCYTKESEEKRLKRLYKTLFNNVKHLIFNLTKQTIEGEPEDI